MYGWRPDADAEVTVTSGATEAIFDAIHAVVRAGEEVIVLDPCYDCYEPAIELAGARAVHVPLDPQTFAPDWRRVRAAITPRTRMLMINSPHNPSGADAVGGRHGGRSPSCCVAPRSAAVRRGLRAHRVRRRAPRIGTAVSANCARARSSISSFGKTYHCTGWKVGYCIAPPALSAEFRKVHQYNTFCSFAPAQYAFAEMIDSEPAALRATAARSTRPSATTSARSCRRRGCKPLPVPGGYFQLVDYSAVSDLDRPRVLPLADERTRGGGDPVIAVLRGTAAAGQRLARLCFAKNEATLDAAIERLQKL